MDQVGYTPTFFCAIIPGYYSIAHVFKVPSLSDEELYFRNLYKAGQRRVQDEKRKQKERREIFNRRFHQLELPLVSNPDNIKWLERKLNTNKRM